MVFKSEAFNFECRDIGNGNCLHVINIEKIDSKLKNLIDSNIVSIWQGKTKTNLAIVKAQIKSFLESKKGSTIEKGAIAEFFLHLYLNEVGFKQECLFQNLEEGAIKKGFDGYYSLEGEEWILESKSGSINTQNISHINKVNEAYNDLNNKISGNVTNDPWNNAFFHAKLAGTKIKILKNIKKLSDDFILNKYPNIQDFNIIPGSTIFLENSWGPINTDELEEKIKKLLKKLKFKKINILCVNKKSLELFKNYLEI